MKVWFVSTFITEHSCFNDEEPGSPDYEYETDYESMFCSTLFATEALAVNERNRLFMESYEKERVAHADRLKRHNKRKEALELLALTGFDPEDLFPYGVGDEPQFNLPRCPRIGYLEVVEG